MGDRVQTRLDYQGLRRWSMLILFPVLLLSSWVAALLMMMVSLPIMLPAFSAATIAGVGIFGVAALVIPPVIGTVAGLLGILRAKGQVVRAFNASRLADEHPLTRVTHDMAARLGMPAPEVYVYPDEDINAWATGTSASNAAVGISRGALDRLSHDHVSAVMGHELGHIAAADLRRMQFAVSFQNALVWFFGFRSWRWNAQHIFGFVGQMGIMGLSRRREYWADAIGAILTSPEAMRDALRAVERDATRPAKQRRYYNQLMFNWPGGNFLASHPTFRQRYAALEQGTFVASSLRQMGAASSHSIKPHHAHSGRATTGRRQVPSLLAARFDIPWVEGAAVVALTIVSFSVVLYALQPASGPASAVVAQVPEPAPVVTSEVSTFAGQAQRVAGWSAEAPAEPTSRTAPATKLAAMPIYPKEPRYEPDDAMGDGELTPYQLLVEEGVACFYRAKLDDTFGGEHLEDAGPDKSDLFVHTLPASKTHAVLSFGMVGAQATECWKKLGGVQREPNMMKRVQQPYDIWVLTDAKSGATAECGIWPVARTVRNGKGGIAAYCR